MNTNGDSYEKIAAGCSLKLETDVLVIGGGPAGAWAAWKAARDGAKVVLVDKGYCGTSGATAPSGTGIWYIPPNPESRTAAMESREAMGGFLAERPWMHRVLEQTYANVNQIAEWGFPFPFDDKGNAYRGSLNGPEYMRLMRKQVKKAGVRILDHSPALQLLIDEHGVGGATGILRQQGGQHWIVRSGAVVIATGGCAFLSKALGCNVLTGDGYLMAAEAGGEMSGMEFSNAYAISAAFGSVTKTAFYNWASFYKQDGSLIEKAGSLRGRSEIARVLLNEPVYAKLDKATEEMKGWMRASNPNFFLPLDRSGIDPFTQPFQITLRLEGTVRGTGGIRIIDDSCATSVQGLYAAGDAATRELICGGFTGGGSHNAAWATSSGFWAGESAAGYALKIEDKASSRSLRGAGEAGIRAAERERKDLDVTDILRQVQAEVYPYDKNLFRTEHSLRASLKKLHEIWSAVRLHLQPGEADSLRAREVVSMLATARWMYASALQRTETRGMHKRTDFPVADAKQGFRLVSGGLDELYVRPERQPLQPLSAKEVSK
ncbi:FAD-dependent oxidoreductase [Paenibacillus eucommiae]|uniref:Succinate dehydrogenase/fumarate reductase flavoprotein subunit n=1 Tax=Paenibacillus eucommiae TaxID=1355755 RepID=A0ABS4J3I6_9BACL|nr:FAD-binding protein [Paenibacillus eucommiae]MBP1994404.1 succinate dehydrogenase/fumarate reductase flavoprotein subunit [Paenibacillus eucommiae]